MEMAVVAVVAALGGVDIAEVAPAVAGGAELFAKARLALHQNDLGVFIF